MLYSSTSKTQAFLAFAFWQKVSAAGACIASANKYTSATAGTSGTVPANCNLATVEAWGAGGGAGKSGGGAGGGCSGLSYNNGSSIKFVIAGAGGGSVGAGEELQR